MHRVVARVYQILNHITIKFLCKHAIQLEHISLLVIQAPEFVQSVGLEEHMVFLFDGLQKPYPIECVTLASFALKL